MKLLSKIKARKLCLKDALILASIVSKYVDVNNPVEGAFEFVNEIVQKISPREYLYCVEMIINKTDKQIEKLDPLDILALFTEGLMLNKIATLLSFYKSL